MFLPIFYIFQNCHLSVLSTSYKTYTLLSLLSGNVYFTLTFTEELNYIKIPITFFQHETHFFNFLQASIVVFKSPVSLIFVTV